jgi:hypothetical protein
MLTSAGATQQQKGTEMEGLEVEGPVFVTQELVPEHARALLREELHHCDPKLPGTSTICVAN